MRSRSVVVALAAGTLLVVGGSVAAAVPRPGTSPVPAAVPAAPVVVVDAAPVPGTLSAVPATGDPYTTVRLTAAVPAGTPDGATVTVSDGTSPLAAGVPVRGGVAQVSTNALGAGTHDLVARVDGGGAELRTTATYGTASAPLGAGDSATMTLVVRIPPGSVTVTSPVVRPAPQPGGHRTADGCAPVRVDGLRVTDTRGARPGFTVTLRTGDRPAGLVPQQVPGNGLRAADLRRPAGDTSVVHYPAGGALGSVGFDGLVVHPHREAGRCVGTVSMTLV